MAGSDITITALTATPTLRGTKLVATVSDPRDGAIPNLAADAVEFYAATVNNFASATKVVEGPGVASGDSEANHAGLIEEQTYYYWALARNKIGSKGSKYPASDTGGVSALAVGMSGIAYGIANGKIVADDHSTDASVASGALKISIKTASGNVPSSSDRAFLAFQNSNVAVGNYQIRPIESDLSLTIPNGATMGRDVSNAARLWLPLIDDGGTLRIGALNTNLGSSFFTGQPLPESGLISALAISTAADDFQLYSSAAVSNKPYRLLGYLDWNNPPSAGSEGVWSAPDVIQPMAPHVLPPGGLIQRIVKRLTASGGGSPTIPFDATVPQSSEGALVDQNFITPTSKRNILQFDIDAVVSASAATHVMLALFQSGGSANAVAAQPFYVPAADAVVEARFQHFQEAAGTSLQTWDLRDGLQSGAATIYFLRNSTSNLLGGAMRGWFAISEYQR